MDIVRKGNYPKVKLPLLIKCSNCSAELRIYHSDLISVHASTAGFICPCCLNVQAIHIKKYE